MIKIAYFMKFYPYKLNIKMNKKSQFKIVLTSLLTLLLILTIAICLVMTMIEKAHQKHVFIDIYEEMNSLESNNLSLSFEISEPSEDILFAEELQVINDLILCQPINDIYLIMIAKYSFLYEMFKRRIDNFISLETYSYADVFNDDIMYLAKSDKKAIIISIYLFGNSLGHIKLNKNDFEKLNSFKFMFNNKIQEISSLVWQRMIQGDLKNDIVKFIRKNLRGEELGMSLGKVSYNESFIFENVDNIFNFLDHYFLLFPSIRKDDCINIYHLDENTDPRYFFINRVVYFIAKNYKQGITVEQSHNLLMSISEKTNSNFVEQNKRFYQFIMKIATLYDSVKDFDPEVKIQSIYLAFLTQS